MNKFFNRLIFVFGLLGFFLAVFLVFEYSRGGPIVCPITGTGCEIVRKSQYSSIMGVSLPYFGTLFYLTIIILTIILSNKFSKKINLLRLIISFAGFIFGAYLTFLEAFIIKAFCTWCILSFIISVIIFKLVVVNFIKTNAQN